MNLLQPYFLYFLCLGILLMFISSVIYSLLHKWREVPMEKISFLGWNLFFFLSLSMFLAFLRGIEGSFHWVDLSSWAPYRYTFFLGVILFFTGLNFFFGGFSFPPLMENTFYPLLLTFPWAPEGAVFILEKMAGHRKWFWLFSLQDFFLTSLYPLIQSILLFSFAWADFNLQYSLILLPLSFLSLVHRIFFFYVDSFLRENFVYLQSLVEVSSPFPQTPWLHRENTPFLVFSLTDLGQKKNYSPEGREVLYNLWLRAAYLRGVFDSRISWNPWIFFFRIISWLLLSMPMDFIPSSFSSQGFPLAFISSGRKGYGSSSISKRFFSQQDYWCNKTQGILLEKNENYIHSHPVSGDPDLRADGKVELTHSKTHGSPPGAIPFSPLDSNGDPRGTSLIPLSQGIVLEEKGLIPLRDSSKTYENVEAKASLEKIQVERAKLGLHICPSNPCPFCSSSSSPFSPPNSHNSSAPSSFPSPSLSSSTNNSQAYKSASSHPMLPPLASSSTKESSSSSSSDPTSIP